MTNTLLTIKVKQPNFFMQFINNYRIIYYTIIVGGTIENFKKFNLKANLCLESLQNAQVICNNICSAYTAIEFNNCFHKAKKVFNDLMKININIDLTDIYNFIDLCETIGRYVIQSQKMNCDDDVKDTIKLIEINRKFAINSIKKFIAKLINIINSFQDVTGVLHELN